MYCAIECKGYTRLAIPEQESGGAAQATRSDFIEGFGVLTAGRLRARLQPAAEALRWTGRRAARAAGAGRGPLIRIHAEKKCTTLLYVSRDGARRARLVVMWYLL